jgi:hypothetical protein
MPTFNSLPNLHKIEHQCYKDGTLIQTQHKDELDRAKDLQDSKDRKRIECDLKFSKDWQLLEKQEKVRQQKDLHQWYTNQLQEKKNQEFIAKQQSQEFGKLETKHFEKQGQTVLPQHKVTSPNPSPNPNPRTS